MNSNDIKVITLRMKMDKKKCLLCVCVHYKKSAVSDYLTAF